jgi:murein DD-endopeptidase MepM/ murein hydrolase activator NlpD
MFEPSISPVRPARIASGWWDDRSYRGGVHEGIDLVVPIGTTVRAVAGGRVTVSSATGSNTGEWISVRHDGGWISRYMHLSKRLVMVGQRVAAGDTIAQSGSAGPDVPTHLHFDLKLDPSRLDEEYVSRFGRPKTGFGTTTDQGIGVPSEPLIPVEVYEPRVIEAARRNGVPLYQSRLRRALPWIAGTSALVALGMLLATRTEG